MGAHTFGGASKGNSGYAGLWTPDEVSKFDNRFYSFMLETTATYNWTKEVKLCFKFV